MPIALRNFWFASEEACGAYLEKLRWPGGFVCPVCGVAQDPYRSSRGRLMCRSCGHQSTVTAGTVFDKTRTPLRVWLAAAWYITNQKQGVSSLGLQRVLGLGSYETAWTMLHRFRRAMVRPERERLKGLVEVDETYLALSDREEPISPVGRKNKTTKVLMAIAVEVHEPKGFGRIRLSRIANDSDACVVPFVQAAIEAGARVRTDGSAAYRSLKELGYDHQRRVMLGSDTPAQACTGWLRWSSGGCWALTMARSSPSTSTPIWMSSCSGSTAALRARAAYCSIGCSSRLWPPTHTPMPTWCERLHASLKTGSINTGWASGYLAILELSGYPLDSYSMSPSPARSKLDDLPPAVWRGSNLATVTVPACSSGWPELDAELPGGGFPAQSLTEILTAQPSVLEWRLLSGAMRAVTEAGKQVVLVAPPKPPHLPGLLQVGLRENNLVWIRADAPAHRLWATEQLVKGNSAGAIFAWLPQARPEQIRRLQVCALTCGAPVFLCRPESARHDSSAAPLRMHVTISVDWELRVNVFKRRGPVHDGIVRLRSVPSSLEDILTPRLQRPSLLLKKSEAVDVVGGIAPASRVVEQLAVHE